MKNINIIIIGNQFSEFSNGQNILTYGQFRCMLKKGLPDNQVKYQIYIGQGLSDSMIDSIYKMLKSFSWTERFSFIGLMQRNRRAVSYFNHKQCIISEPEKISDYLFRCYLMLNEQDTTHSTEQHIQGLALLEAAQQMVESISAKFFISPLMSEKKSFVLNQVNSTFWEYVFPLDVEFICKLKQFRYGLDGNFKADAAIQVKQNKKIVMAVDIGFSIMEKATLLNIENHMGTSLVNDLINGPCLRLVEQLTA